MELKDLPPLNPNPPAKKAIAKITISPINTNKIKALHFCCIYIPINNSERAYPGPSKFIVVSLSKLKAGLFLSDGESVVLCGKTCKPKSYV